VRLRAGALEKRKRSGIQSQGARDALGRVGRERYEHLAEVESEVIGAAESSLAERVQNVETGIDVFHPICPDVAQARVLRLEEKAHVLGEAARQDEPYPAKKEVGGVAPADRILKLVCPRLKQESEPEVHGVIDGNNHLGTG